MTWGDSMASVMEWLGLDGKTAAAFAIFALWEAFLGGSKRVRASSTLELLLYTVARLALTGVRAARRIKLRRPR